MTGCGDHSDATGDNGRAALRGFEHRYQHRSGLCDIRSCDACDQSVTAGERGHPKRTVPTRNGVTAEVIAVDSQQELAASGGCADG